LSFLVIYHVEPKHFLITPEAIVVLQGLLRSSCRIAPVLTWFLSNKLSDLQARDRSLAMDVVSSVTGTHASLFYRPTWIETWLNRWKSLKSPPPAERVDNLDLLNLCHADFLNDFRFQEFRRNCISSIMEKYSE
jgi:hypothetical protein